MVARIRSVCLLLNIAGVLIAQQTPPAPQPAPPTGTGVAADWQIKQNMAKLADQVRKLEPVLNEAKPDRWTVNGAPESYIKLFQSAQLNVKALIAATDQLARQPEKLSAALDAYFRMEGMEAMLGSVRDGIRKYQDGALADRLTRLMADTSNSRDQLRALITDLAATREAEFRIMDEEAQRCRAQILTQPSVARKSDRKVERK